jgi:pyrimidine-nucleoside phosphorylase
MRVVDIIHKKRDRVALSPEEIRFFVQGYARGDIPDYQASALLMATYLNGMTDDETLTLTDEMLHSGEILDWSELPGIKVDKHSTGGVGDKTSLILAPIAAAAGVVVPMISGRGLGHTGGTLDKLEAIPGFRTGLSLAEARAQLDRLGVVMLGQTPELVPADRKLYALRDVTGTVESIPLISASIMSKKLAEGLDALVLDVKRGSGAFLPDDAQALELARTMLDIGHAHGCRTTALLTAMDRPLGHACGNALEVEEAIAGLRGEGPPDLMVVTLALAEEALVAAEPGLDRVVARARVEGAVASGAALDMLRRLVEAQGGNPRVVDDPGALPQAPCRATYVASRAGVVVRVAPRPIGEALVGMGGGRAVIDDTIDPAVGFHVTAKPGDTVARGEALASIFARDAAGLARGRRALDEAIVIGEATDPLPLVSHRVTAAGVERLP